MTRTIKVPIATYELARALVARLQAQGTDALPLGLRPAASTRISIGLVVAIALELLENDAKLSTLPESK